MTKTLGLGFVVGFSALAACGGANNNVLTDAGGGDMVGGGGGDMTTTASPDLALPARTACAAPMTATGDTVKAALGDALTSPRLAVAGDEVALVWAAGPFNGPTWKVQLQRFTTAGKKKDAEVSLGTAAARPTVAVAGDGTRWLACWDAEGVSGTIGCAAVPVGTGAAVAGAKVTGKAPALAFGGGGFALAYQGSGTVTLQKLGSDGMAVGMAAPLANSTAAVPRITTTTAGYALVYAPTANGSWRLARVGDDLAAVGSAVTLAGSSSAGQVAIAAAGNKVGAVWIEHGMTTQVSATVVDEGGTATARVPINAMAQLLFVNVAAAGGDRSFAFAWSDGGGFVGYRAVDDTGVAQGMPRQLGGTAWDDNPLDLVAVTDGYLVATAVNSGLDTIHLVHATCP